MKYSSLQRPGLSLTEVLIAIFTLALGLLGILSLFPLAAVNMANAIKDENTAQLNQSASAVMRVWWKEETPYPAVLFPNPPAPYRYDPFFNVMTNVNFPVNPDYAPDSVFPPAYTSAVPALQPPNVPMGYNLPSYPVFIDPVGWHNGYNFGTAQQYWLGGNDPLVAASTYLTIPRRSLRRIEYSPAVIGGLQYYPTPNPSWNILINRYCFRLDDIGFGKDGTPYDDTGIITNTSGLLGVPLNGTIQRDGRYSCGFMLKRSAANLVRESDLTIVVYNARSIDGPSDEKAYQAQFVKDSTEAVINYVGDKPRLRKGNWILDATMVRPTGTALIPEPHGYFYRIVSINDETPGQLILELQTPAHQSTLLPTGQPYGLGIVMDGVVEVFERSTLTQFTMPVP